MVKAKIIFGIFQRIMSCRKVLNTIASSNTKDYDLLDEDETRSFNNNLVITKTVSIEKITEVSVNNFQSKVVQTEQHEKEWLFHPKMCDIRNGKAVSPATLYALKHEACVQNTCDCFEYVLDQPETSTAIVEKSKNNEKFTRLEQQLQSIQDEIKSFKDQTTQ